MKYDILITIMKSLKDILKKQPKVIYLGDFGGNDLVLQKTLENLEVINFQLPKNLIIVQVGDMLRCHPNYLEHNDSIFQMTKKLIIKNPDNYIQILGNHELGALGGPDLETWDTKNVISKTVTEGIKELWQNRQLTLSHSVGNVLITHGGLVVDLWKQLNKPNTSAKASKLINENNGQDISTFAHRATLGFPRQEGTPDVTWASVSELYKPWLKEDFMPFSQIHGHATPYNWYENHFINSFSSNLKSKTRINKLNKIAMVSSTKYDKTKYITCVDWALPNKYIKDVNNARIPTVFLSSNTDGTCFRFIKIK